MVTEGTREGLEVKEAGDDGTKDGLGEGSGEGVGDRLLGLQLGLVGGWITRLDSFEVHGGSAIMSRSDHFTLSTSTLASFRYRRKIMKSLLLPPFL